MIRLKPWDSKQTFESLRCLTIEETYELTDAIIENKPDDMRGELGDLMLHLVFYSKIADEKGLFNITDVLNGICEKLIRRHPHIFSTTHVDNEEDVKMNWEKIKLKEGNKSVLGGVPQSLPAMVKAYRIQDKAHGVGFDWDNSEQVWDKVVEEMSEFKTEMDKNSNKKEEEFGDLLFALINFARHNHIHVLMSDNFDYVKTWRCGSFGPARLQNHAVARDDIPALPPLIAENH